MNDGEVSGCETILHSANTAHFSRYLRRLAALKIVSSLTSRRRLFLSHAVTSWHSVQLCKMIMLGTPSGQSALMAINARSRSGVQSARRFSAAAIYPFRLRRRRIAILIYVA